MTAPMQPTLNIIAFNTGALYSGKGQRIAYVVMPEWIHFHDRDRMISGSIKRSQMAIKYQIPVTNHFVLQAYLDCSYDNWSVPQEIERALMAACDALLTRPKGPRSSQGLR
jgi:hypothetical protein